MAKGQGDGCMKKYSNSEFVHWHCHSSYSSFDGLSQMEKLVMYARKSGFPALALTDHGTIGGWISFLKHCKSTNDKEGEPIDYDPIKPILGMEAYLCANHEDSSNKEQLDGRKGNRHLNIFAKNYKGYQNLCRLSQESYTEGFFHDPRIDLNQLAKYSEGLIVSTACLSSVVNSNLLNDRYDEAKRACSIFKDIFGEDFFLEVMFHGIAAERMIVPDIFKLSSQLDIPVVCTNDSHYIKKEHAQSQEVLMCMSTSKCLNDPKHIRFPYGEFYLKDAEEMAQVWGDSPEVLHNSLAMLEKVDTDDIERNLFGGMRLPKFDLPEGFNTPHEYLEHLAKEGMEKLGWDKSEKHVKQLELELSDVKVALENNGYDFATYFLIVWDCINYAKEHDILTGCGRGSGFASVLLRSLGITYGPDPMNYDLLWERFLAFDDVRYIKESDFFDVDDGGIGVLVTDEEEEE